MKLSETLRIFPFLCVFLHISRVPVAANDNERQAYIVYMGEVPEDRISLRDVHHGLLSEIIGDEAIARKSKIHSYGRSFNGFVARLLPHEAKMLSEKEGIVSVFPNRVQQLMTTRSWDFVGLTEKAQRNYPVESDTIVALLDTGILVESPSFNDKGFGPPPRKWKGKCAKGGNFTGCNNKVIGAQYFNLAMGDQSDDQSGDAPTPVDVDGHGTHTASTAAGVAVQGASLYGIAEGTAHGAVPAARVASYKVCWGIGCQDMDILAGFDAAIADGVDIISVSLGGASRRFTEDPVAIGAFHASMKGILTVCAAGNAGPTVGTVSNVAPWVMTVAATTVDRKFETGVKLGNGEEISGIAINTFVPKKKFYPLTNGPHAQNFSGDTYGNASACDSGTLSKTMVKGKIVYCQGAGGDTTIEELGGFGTIMSNDAMADTAFPTVMPGTYVSTKDGLKIDSYINNTKSALAVIYKTRTVNITAPAIASFSSRGPQTLAPNILKPDIAAPGVNILAAYTKFATVTGSKDDTRVVKFNLESGTSMACPHVSGAAAYVRSFHPTWSPAAIKSALMTTSKRMKIKPHEVELASGSGQINPRAAVNPGLVYDIKTNSYISYLCRLGYSDKDIALMTGNNKYSCAKAPKPKGQDGLNYPTIYLQLNYSTTPFSAVFHRAVTNVDAGKGLYRATIKVPKGLSVTVTPNILTFDRLYQKRSFKVMVSGKLPHKHSWYLSGSLIWSDSKHHSVRSPILVCYDSGY